MGPAEGSSFHNPQLGGEKRRGLTSADSNTSEGSQNVKKPKLSNQILSVEDVCTEGAVIDDRYVVETTLGEGTFGKVMKVMDQRSKKPFAMKVIKDKGMNSIEIASAEMDILIKLRDMDKENKSRIVCLQHHFQTGGIAFMVFELLEQSLLQYIRGSEYMAPLKIVKIVGYQILQALEFLQKFNICHADLKPQNIMIKDVCTMDIKVIDLGSHFVKGDPHSLYIQTRYYRAPEAILGAMYDTGLDMWSLGCILYELHTGYPIFRGRSEIVLIQKMVQVLGPFPNKIIRQGKKHNLFFKKVLKRPTFEMKDKSMLLHEPGTLSLFKLINESWGNKFSTWQTCEGDVRSFIQVLRKMFVYDRLKRISVEDAKDHRFFNEVKKSLDTGGVYEKA